MWGKRGIDKEWTGGWQMTREVAESRRKRLPHAYRSTKGRESIYDAYSKSNWTNTQKMEVQLKKLTMS